MTCNAQHLTTGNDKAEILDKWLCNRCEEELEVTKGQKPRSCPNPNCLKHGPFTALSGPYLYFNGEKFVPKRLADDIMAGNHFITHKESHVMYHYKDGIYNPDGEEVVKEISRQKLGSCPASTMSRRR